jgi:hypothetical protein
MTRRSGRIARAAAALAFAGALGFGTVHAFARPAAAAGTAAYCNSFECLNYCVEMEGTGGRCKADQWGNFVCICG